MTKKYDSYARDHLPVDALLPEFDLSDPIYDYPTRFNCVTEFLDKWIERGHGARRCIVTPERTWSYRDLYESVNQLANLLVDEMGLVPGNRVLLRAPNNAMMVVSYLAVIKAGAIAIGTMPLLRASELQTIIDKAEITHALCDARLADEFDTARANCPTLNHYAYFNGDHDDDLANRLDAHSTEFTAYDSAADETCLIAFTSGTTGKPKGTMHFHRDMLAICDGFSAQVLQPTQDDLFCGSPPIAFTFGLGGLVLFPLRAGAAMLLVERVMPTDLLQAVNKFKPTIIFTAPTAYRAMLAEINDENFASIRKGVSAGEHLPEATWRAFKEKTGIALIDGIGATEMLHIFISAREEDIRPGSTGLPVTGFQVRIMDDEGNELPRGEIGSLAVKGPTGCRYLADERQTVYVRDGWNYTGDTYRMDADGYLWYQARSDDMIISAGYNIAGPEVENALLTHPAVVECAVIGVPDEQRGQIVKAYVLLTSDQTASDELIKSLQEHVKQTIAPYKYPRAITFVTDLPKTPTGKLQRFKLKEL
jgi:2-aminobenzoate-CoA ligase